MNKRVILSTPFPSIEPLAPMHLATIAREEGWEPKIVLGSRPDFREIQKAIKEYEPQLLGFSIFTGDHQEIFDFLDKTKREHPQLEIAIGGPHITVFLEQSLSHATYVVPSEGFRPLREILQGKAKPGIVPPRHLEKIPTTTREQFYQDYPRYGQSPIKSVITQMGCPHSCSYCYNSLKLQDIEESMTPQQAETMRNSLGRTERLFPKSKRPIDEVINEIYEIRRISPKTKLIFFQDDAFATSINWLREFAEKYDSFPFHALSRFEFLDPSKDNGRERGQLLKKAGCTGLTFAIESEDAEIREEVLERGMKGGNELIFRTLDYCRQLGFTTRAYSMLGLPYGATSSPTRINLEQDLENLKLNVRLREKTGLPTVAWASILVPYAKTKIDRYCHKHGNYVKNHEDIHSIGFRDESVLRFPKKWVGPGLRADTPGAWLSEEENQHYRRQLKTLMAGFPLFALLPNGHEVARRILEKENLKEWSLYDFALKPEVLQHVPQSQKYAGDLKQKGKCDEVEVNNITRVHLYDRELYKTK
jgi:radical SAM superfamily enzyme YgiQ (UPF0313 family)